MMSDLLPYSGTEIFFIYLLKFLSELFFSVGPSFFVYGLGIPFNDLVESYLYLYVVQGRGTVEGGWFLL